MSSPSHESILVEFALTSFSAAINAIKRLSVGNSAIDFGGKVIEVFEILRVVDGF